MTTPQTFAAAIAAAVVQPATNMQNATRSTELLPAVGTAGWDDALGQKVVWMVKGAEQTATLTLNPPELGPMQVTVNVSNNQATANFVAHQPEVRHALEASMPRLREMLNEAGIQLGQSSVSAGMPNQQGGADEARQGSSGRRAARTDGITADATTQVTHVPTPLGGTGMVDTFA
jgi:flagellar hook-length control protein FliK